MERKCVLFHSQNGDVDKLYLNEKPDKSEFDEVCVLAFYIVLISNNLK